MAMAYELDRSTSHGEPDQSSPAAWIRAGTSADQRGSCTLNQSPSPSSPRLVTVELGGCSELRKKERFCGLTQNRGLMMGTAAYLVALALVEGAGRFKRSR